MGNLYRDRIATLLSILGGTADELHGEVYPDYWVKKLPKKDKVAALKIQKSLAIIEEEINKMVEALESEE